MALVPIVGEAGSDVDAILEDWVLNMVELIELRAGYCVDSWLWHLLREYAQLIALSKGLDHETIVMLQHLSNEVTGAPCSVTEGTKPPLLIEIA